MKRSILAAGLAFLIIAVIGCSFAERQKTADRPRIFGATQMEERDV